MIELATLEEAEAAIKRLRKALADVGVGKSLPLPEPDAAPPPQHWQQEREPGED